MVNKFFILALISTAVISKCTGQSIRNKDHEFLIPVNYSLINPAHTLRDSSDFGLIYESFMGARNVYATSHYYLNYRQLEKLNIGLTMYNDIQQDFSNQISIGLPIGYKIVNSKNVKIETALKPILWNFILHGNDFFAGKSLWSFNLDAGIDIRVNQLNLAFSANNIVPSEFKLIEQSVVLQPEYNILVSYDFNRYWNAYSHVGRLSGINDYIIGGSYGYDEVAYLNFQWSFKSGGLVGGKYHLEISNNLIWQFSAFYGLGASSRSQYSIQTGLLF